jgi:hypothetical protein
MAARGAVSHPLSPTELAELRNARQVLEHPGLAIRLADYAGMPVEGLLRRLPSGAQELVGRATNQALLRALQVALLTLGQPGRRPARNWLHRGMVVATGAVGGAAGLPGLIVELPVSLTLMLRSIADHARAQGEDLSLVAGRLECLSVLAYGSRSPSDDAADSAYFTTRAALAQSVTRAAEFVTRHGLREAAGRKGAPAMVRLVASIAERLGVSIADKTAAQLVPVAGAAGGAALNALFLSHYQDVAGAHFTVRRLERAHGAELVRRAYLDG